MRIKADKVRFQRELALVQAVVERRHTIPILSHVRIRAQGEYVELIGTDLDVSVRTHSPARVLEEGMICLPARKLHDIVRAMPEQEIELTSSEQWAILQAGRSRFRVAGLHPENFPDIPEFPNRVAREWNTSELRRATLRVQFATAQEEMRYALSGIHTEWWEGGMRLVATDGHRLALTEVGAPPSSDREIALIPRKTMSELVRLIVEAEKEKEEGLMVEFARDANHVYFRVGGREIAGRLLTGQFPNYEMVIPRDGPGRAILSTAIFQGACRRVSLLADERSRGIQLNFSPDTLLVVARRHEEDEEAREELPCQYEGEPLEIAFNSEYLLDFLDVVESESVEIILRDGQSPALFRPLGDVAPAERYLYVVMPMRLG